MQLLLRTLICLNCLLIFSSFSPNTFVFSVSGKIVFAESNKGSTEGLYVQIYGDGELLSEDIVDKNGHFELDFLDLHYKKVGLYWKEEGIEAFFIMDLSLDKFHDQFLKVVLKI